MAYWKTLHTDPDAVFDRELTLDASALEPMVTYGTNPGQGVPVTGRVPRTDDLEDPGEGRIEVLPMQLVVLAFALCNEFPQI